MITQAMIAQRAREIALRAAVPLDQWAIDEAKIQLGQEAAQAAQAAAAKAQAENPQPAFNWERYDMIDRRGLAAFDAAADPQRAAAKAARRAQIEAQMKPLVAQRDALNRRIAELDDEWRANL